MPNLLEKHKITRFHPNCVKEKPDVESYPEIKTDQTAFGLKFALTIQCQFSKKILNLDVG